MPRSSQPPKLRAREVVFAVALGGLAALAAGTIMSLDDEGPAVPQAAAAGPDRIDYEVAPFTEISTIGPQDIVITRGEAYSVRSEGRPDALGRLEVVAEDGKLTIRPKAVPDFGDWRRLGSATFHITVPTLERFSLAGSGDVRIDNIEGEEFEATIAGPGEIAIAGLKVDEADLTVNGNGTITVAGTARETSVQVSGPGDVRGSGLTSQTASVSVGGPGEVDLRVERDARISMMGPGDVDIDGPARCSVSSMGAGNVRCEAGSD